MKPALLSALLCVVSAPGVRADEPPAPPTETACATYTIVSGCLNS